MVDQWRLSRIQEEMENLDLPPPSPPPSAITQLTSLERSKYVREISNQPYIVVDSATSAHYRRIDQQPNRQIWSDQGPADGDREQSIYSKAVIAPVYHDKPLPIEQLQGQKAAVKKITEKYDSLGRNGMGLLNSDLDSSRNGSIDSNDHPVGITMDANDCPPVMFVPHDTASVGADPNFPPPPTQDELTNACGVPTTSSKPSRLLTGHLKKHKSSANPASIEIGPHIQHTPQSCLLSEAELLQIEMFYRSHGTEVWVSQCTAHLHLGTVKVPVDHHTSKSSDIKHDRKAKHPKQPIIVQAQVDHWKYVKTGVPVFLLDSGKSHRQRKLYIILSEKGTGFTIWRDLLNHLSCYRAATSVFHTMHLSDDHNNMAGFSFDDANGATDFLAKFSAITSPPNEDILNLSGKSKNKNNTKKKHKEKVKAVPQKSNISSPCCFTHVTKLNKSDGMTILGSKTPTHNSIALSTTNHS